MLYEFAVTKLLLFFETLLPLLLFLLFGQLEFVSKGFRLRVLFSFDEVVQVLASADRL